MNQITIPEPAVTLTDRAAARIKQLASQDDNQGMMLRLSISGGGCSGFQYGFALEAKRHDDDMAVERDGVTLLIDEVSLGLLGGAEIDYTEEMVGSRFTVRNPNAAASCGCGNSFSVG
ncbi:MAG: iron-sulfur cluster insertion protein ErpA [Alphaproteobacteria bacterium]